MLTACNSVYIKPNTMDTTQLFYADRGGYTMKHHIKSVMEDRGYKVVVGKKVYSETISNDDNINIEKSNTMGARYIVNVREKTEKFHPVFCLFSGFYMWDYSVSIADQKTGAELLNWTGFNCAHSSIRKLEDYLEELEKN